MAPDRGRVYGGQSESERRAERRERLLVAGTALFGAHGWEGTSIERLCTESGVSTRYFYEEFRGREELLEAVYRSTAEQAVARVLAALRSPGTPEQRVSAGLRAYLEHVTADPSRVRLLHQDARRIPSLKPILTALTVTYWKAMTAAAAGLDADAGADLAPIALVRARAVSGAINEVLAHWLATPGGRPDVDPVIDRLVATVAPAILATAPAP